MNDAKQFWTARGFSHICTGGNCYAWERTFVRQGFHSVQVLVTSNDDQETRRLGEVHNVGLYLSGQGEAWDFDYFLGAQSAWQWIVEKLGIAEEGAQ